MTLPHPDSSEPTGNPPTTGVGGNTGFHAVVPQRQHVEAHPTGKRLAWLSFTALGVVYGDIGTSPLYAMQQAFSPAYGLAPDATNVYGVLSMILWSLIIVVAVKYIAFIMRADNRREGGVMALLALVLQNERRAEDKRRRRLLILVGIFGAALLYGDGMITPAISVLSATEGLNGLRSLIQLLGEQPGRKTVVVFSTGIPATDRPGGRPDVGDIAKLLGQDAAATNTTIYTLLVNTRGFQSMASETRKNDRIPTSLSRDTAVASRLLEEFSGASGGALMRVLMGGGDVALDRVLRETSSHYLLGVEPADTDRDGSLRELRVKIGQNGATIRARSWVVVPKRKI